jgi:hypothetical protein
VITKSIPGGTSAVREAPGKPHGRGAHRPLKDRAAFQGRYVVQSVQRGDPRAFPIEVVLRRRGDQVDGQSTFGLGLGTIEGTVSGDTLRFAWSWAGNYGQGVFRIDRDGRGLSGTWGYRESADNTGTWCGRRAN